MATASGAQGLKQTKGYFVTVAVLPSTLQYSAPTVSGAGGSYQVGPLAAQTTGTTSLNIAAGQYLKDMGKTVVSSTRTFRKVQLLMANGPVLTATGAASGAPFYIELVNSQSAQAGAAQVAYLPGLF